MAPILRLYLPAKSYWTSAKSAYASTTSGVQRHPDTPPYVKDGNVDSLKRVAAAIKELVDTDASTNQSSWLHILDEEYHEMICEAWEESKPGALREELIQLIAVATAWVETIDDRTADITRSASGRCKMRRTGRTDTPLAFGPCALDKGHDGHHENYDGQQFTARQPLGEQHQ